MKYILILSAILLSSCGGGTETEPPEMLTDIEICLDQGGEWADDQCVFFDESEYYETLDVMCKMNSQYCPKRGGE